MKTIILLIALSLPLAADETDKEALRSLRSIYEKAIASRDLNALKPHLAGDFTAVTITAEEVKGFDGILAYWEKVEDFIGKDGSYQVTLDPDDTLFEGNLAIAKGRAREHVVRSGKTIEFTSLWTAIARKEDGSWKIVRIHAGIDPVSNPIIAVLQGAKMWMGSLAALIAGLFIGWLLGRKKRSAS
jgi:ketosteroid isomerase-like protein